MKSLDAGWESKVASNFVRFLAPCELSSALKPELMATSKPRHLFNRLEFLYVNFELMIFPEHGLQGLWKVICQKSLVILCKMQSGVLRRSRCVCNNSLPAIFQHLQVLSSQLSLSSSTMNSQLDSAVGEGVSSSCLFSYLGVAERQHRPLHFSLILWGKWSHWDWRFY
jgi:hypothetical protein